MAVMYGEWEIKTLLKEFKIVNYEMGLRLSPFTSTFDISTHHPVIYQLQIDVIM
jgi:hypothetical protein